MFWGCWSLISLDLSSFDTTQVLKMDYMFSYCSSLMSLDLSTFNTSQVKSMFRMFAGCSSLMSLDLSTFNTTKVLKMDYMFSGCSSLMSLDLSTFNTIQVLNMDDMFSDCSSLISLDLSTFNTTQVKSMFRMFAGCSSLISLDLSTFYTTKVLKMDYMFSGCSSLISLNISGFNTLKVESMKNMFQWCYKLDYLILPNFNLTKANNLEYMFYACSQLEYINLKQSIIRTDQQTLKIFDLTPKNMIISSNNIKWSKFFSEYKLIKCINNINFNFPEFFCFMNYSIPYNKYSCEICGLNFHEKYNDSYDNNAYINCYESPDGYYLDQQEKYSIYTPCYFSCKRCNIKGNEIENNCIECNDDYEYIFNLNTSIYSNCYKNCNYYHYYDADLNKSYCTQDYKCPEKYNKLILDKNECIDNCSKDSIYKYEIENICYNESIYNEITTYIILNSTIISTYINNTIFNSNINTFYLEKTYKINTKENTNLIDSIINTYEISTIMNSFKTIEAGNKTEFIKYITENVISNCNNWNKIYRENIDAYNLKILLSSTINQIEDDIFIDLKECEDILKNNYNISKNSSLYILKLIIEEKGMKIPKVEYEVYYPLYNISSLTKLNLSFCKGKKVDISIPVNINDSLDKYNPDSDYYNNVCSKTTSFCGTDISLKDRRNEFIENNMTLCEEDCKLVDYNYKTEKVKCSCDIKINIPFIEDIKFDKDELRKSFTDIKNIVNINIMKCYKNVFDKSLLKNIGFYILAFMLIIYFISLLIFRFRSFIKLTTDIKDIFSALKNKEKKIIPEKNMKKTRKIKNNFGKNELLNLNFHRKIDTKVIKNENNL